MFIELTRHIAGGGTKKTFVNVFSYWRFEWNDKFESTEFENSGEFLRVTETPEEIMHKIKLAQEK